MVDACHKPCTEPGELCSILHALTMKTAVKAMNLCYAMLTVQSDIVTVDVYAMHPTHLPQCAYITFEGGRWGGGEGCLPTSLESWGGGCRPDTSSCS